MMSNYQASDGTLFQSNASIFPGYAQPVVQLSDADYSAAVAALPKPTPPVPTQAQLAAVALPQILVSSVQTNAVPSNAWAAVVTALKAAIQGGT